LIDAREVALAAVEVLVTMRVKDTPDKVLFGGLAVTFKVARYLGLQVYASTGWALYDSLAKVAGILCCVDERSKNEAKPVKLPEDFLKEKKWVGARVRDHLKGGYGWPIGVSYAIRNWLVHDGHSQNGFPLFKYESPDLGPFEIANEAWKKIEEKCTSYGVSSVDTRLRPFPDVKGDVLNGLKSCNAEVDEAMSFLILWSVNGVKRQAELLFARDNA
jgi:hypothetical protein